MIALHSYGCLKAACVKMEAARRLCLRSYCKQDEESCAGGAE